ncbi:MAG: DUF3575 domain-containing protein [Bacteroidetes bacterium]|nr:DUF3575 domain-containing protein [Bacteroidota bacterium]
MKKTIYSFFIVAIILLGVSFTAHSQTGATNSKIYRQAVTTDPGTLIMHDRFNVKYEQSISRKNSFTADLMYNWNYNTEKYTNVGITLGAGYRWYFHNIFPEIRTRGIEGLAVGPLANINYVRWKVNDDNSNNRLGIDVGIEAVYKFVLFEALAIEPALRLGWGIPITEFGEYNKDFQLWPGVSIGYAW